MRNNQLRYGLVIVTGCVLFSVACSGERSLAPANGSLGPAKPALNLVLSGTTSQSGDTLVTVFTVNNGDTTKVRLFNTASVTFTPNSICDLGSSYGPSEWDQPCAPSTTPVVIVARGWLDENGQPRVDFQPHMRFNPDASPIIISLKDAHGQGEALHINYCPDFGACYDESIADSSLATGYDSSTKRYFRRIKHFSGYNISSGFAD
jgi:hypothetical protein